MPKGIYQHKPFSEETKRKMSESHKGKSKPWLKGKRPPNWETLYTPEINKKRSKSLKGRKRSEEIRKKISEGHKGEKNWNWKGGITPLILQIRHSFKYRQWRSDIFTKDNFTCHKCGKKGIYLEADHYPKRFSAIMSGNYIKTFEEALNCEELWNINNGRTLCRDCHKKTKGRICLNI